MPANDKLNQLKIEFHRRKFGEMTSEQALSLAIEADTFAKDCGVGDPAFNHFAEEAQALTSYAQALEVKENEDASLQASLETTTRQQAG